MNLFKLFRRPEVDSEEARRTRLLRQGRIADGLIIDIGVDADERTVIIYFIYQHNGVDYESSHTLDDAQRGRAADYPPGATVTIRFDPRVPSNSIVV